MDLSLRKANLQDSEEIFRIQKIAYRSCILPEYQENGYAQQAINQVEILYPQAKRWELITIKQEQKLCYLYEKAGYTSTGQEKHIKSELDLIKYIK